MKHKEFTKKILLACWLGISVMVFSYVESENDSGYGNTIVAVQEITGMSGQKLILTFEHPDPIVLYVPENYTESTQKNLYRVLMPETAVADGVTTSFEMYQTDSGVELLLQGNSFKKIISGNIVVFAIESCS